jgi:hypothetical protein
VSWLRRWLALPLAAVLLVALATSATSATSALAGGAPAKGKKGKKGGGKVTAMELGKTLQDKGSEVQDCAVMHALNKGANRIDIATKVTINGRGQVIDIRTVVKVDGGDGAPKVRDCIDTIIKGIKFPPTEAPLVNIERNWTIAST